MRGRRGLVRAVTAVVASGVVAAALGVAGSSTAGAAGPTVAPNLVVASRDPRTSATFVDDVNLLVTNDQCQHTQGGTHAFSAKTESAVDIAVAPNGNVYEMGANNGMYSLGVDVPGTAWASAPTLVATSPSFVNGLVMLDNTFAYAAGADLIRLNVSTGAAVDLGPLPASDEGDLTFKNGSVFFVGGATPTLYQLPVSALANNTAAAGSILASAWTNWGAITGVTQGYGLATDGNGHSWILDPAGTIHSFVIPSTAQTTIAVGPAVRAFNTCPSITREWVGLGFAAEGTNAAASSLTVTKAGPAMVTAGGDATYAITVTNASGGPADNVLVTDPLPDAQLSLTSVSSTDCSALPCVIPVLLPGGSETIQVTFHVPAGYSGRSPYPNRAFIGCAAGDPACTAGATQGSNVVATTVTTPVPSAGVGGTSAAGALSLLAGMVLVAFGLASMPSRRRRG